MSSVHLITVSPSIQKGEESTNDLVIKKQFVDLLFSNFNFVLVKSKSNISSPVELNAQTPLWKKTLEVNTVNLNFHKFSEVSALKTSGKHNRKSKVFDQASIKYLGLISSAFLFHLIEGCVDVFLNYNRALVIYSIEAHFYLIHIDIIKILTTTIASIVPTIPEWYIYLQNIKNINNLAFFNFFNSFRPYLNYLNRLDGLYK